MGISLSVPPESFPVPVVWCGRRLWDRKDWLRLAKSSVALLRVVNSSPFPAVREGAFQVPAQLEFRLGRDLIDRCCSAFAFLVLCFGGDWSGE